MNRYKRYDQFTRISSVAGGLALSAYFSAKTLVKPTPEIQLLASIFIVGISYPVMRLLFDRALHFSFFRYNYLKHEYIEGVWIGFVMNQEGEVITWGVKRIWPRGGELLYSGENYDPKTLSLVGSYSSRMTSLEWPVFEYTYVYSHRERPEVEKSGYGRLRFHDANALGAPNQHSGYFVDFIEGVEKRYEIESWRVTNREDIDALQDPRRKREKIAELMPAVLEEFPILDHA